MPKSGKRASNRAPLLASFTTSGAIHLLGLVTGVILARTLGPEDRGALAAVVLWPFVLAEIASLSLTQAVTYSAARRRAPTGALTGTATGMGLGQSALAMLAGLALLPLILSGYESGTLDDARLYLLYIPLGLTALLLMAVLNGLQRLASFQLLRLLVAVLSTGGLLILLATDAVSVRSAVLVYLAANVLTGVAATVLVARTRPGRLSFQPQLARSLLDFGLRSHLARVAGILNVNLGQLVISIALGATDLGIYVIAVTMTSLTSLIGYSTALVALPVVAALEDRRERVEAVRFFTGATLLGAVAISVPLIVFAPQLIDLFFGASFSAAAPVSRILLVAAVIFSCNRAMESLLQAVGRPLEAGLGELVALISSAAAIAVLLPLWGLEGAGAAALIAYSIAAVFMVRRLGVALDTPVRSLLRPDRGLIEELRILRRGTPGGSQADPEDDLGRL